MNALSDLYKTDFHAWTQRAAALVREHKLDELNLDDLAEELDSMGAKKRRELMNRLDALLAHLLKWEHQPDHRTASWAATIREQRRQIAREVKLSPSLKPFLPEALADVYSDSVERAGFETGLPEHLFPRNCPYSLNQMMLQIAEERRLPFDMKMPNAKTHNAIGELEAGKGKCFDNVAALMADLNADDGLKARNLYVHR